MQKQKIQFCKRSSPDNQTQSRTEGTRSPADDGQPWTIHKSISAEKNKSNTAIRRDPEEKM